MCSPRLYEPVLPSLWRFGPVTVADTCRDATMSGMAARLLDTASGSFALVGLSMGGYLALEVMRQAPERVRALALLSTSARADTEQQTAARREELARVDAGRFDEVVDHGFPLVVDVTNEGDRRLRDVVRAMAAEVGPEVFRAQMEAVMGRSDSRPLLPRIACPTLVLHGAGDRLIDPERGREMAAAIPDARLEMIDRCGHSPTLEQPDATARALTSLLNQA